MDKQGMHWESPARIGSRWKLEPRTTEVDDTDDEDEVAKARLEKRLGVEDSPGVAALAAQCKRAVATAHLENLTGERLDGAVRYLSELRGAELFADVVPTERQGRWVEAPSGNDSDEHIRSRGQDLSLPTVRERRSTMPCWTRAAPKADESVRSEHGSGDGPSSGAENGDAMTSMARAPPAPASQSWSEFSSTDALVGGVKGVVYGGAYGAAVGMLPAVFTLGLSIPVGAVVGAAYHGYNGFTTRGVAAAKKQNHPRHRSAPPCGRSPARAPR